MGNYLASGFGLVLGLVGILGMHHEYQRQDIIFREQVSRLETINGESVREINHIASPDSSALWGVLVGAGCMIYAYGARRKEE